MFVQAIDVYERNWRSLFKRLFLRSLSPDKVYFESEGQQGLLQPNIFSGSEKKQVWRIHPQLVQDFDSLMLHQNTDKWSIAYQIFFRYFNGDRAVVKDLTWPPMLKMQRMVKNIGRDIHKMHAFVRFKKIEQSDKALYLAWHESDHLIFKAASSFFIRRFGNMNWMIIGPKEQMGWDGQQLYFQQGLMSKPKMPKDKMDELWKHYYASIFNPARVKVNMMKSEMPMRYWKNLPEAEVIPELLSAAPSRVKQMHVKGAKKQKTLAAAVKNSLLAKTKPSQLSHGQKNKAIKELFSQIKTCEACFLREGDCAADILAKQPWKNGRDLLLIGKASGPQDFEKRKARALASFFAQFPKASQPNVTLAIKHWVRPGPKSIGKAVAACRPWLKHEVDLSQAKTIFVQDTVALLSARGYASSLKQAQGKRLPSVFGPQIWIV